MALSVVACGAAPEGEGFATSTEALLGEPYQRDAAGYHYFSHLLPFPYWMDEVAIGTTSRIGNLGLAINDRARVLGLTSGSPVIDPTVIAHAGLGRGDIELGQYSWSGHSISSTDIFLRNPNVSVSRTVDVSGRVYDHEGDRPEGTFQREEVLRDLAQTGLTLGPVTGPLFGNRTLPSPNGSGSGGPFTYLPPGRYDRVQVAPRARVEIGPGNYEFQELVLEPESVVYFRNYDPINLIVQGSFIFRSEVELDYPEPGNIAIGVAGSQAPAIDTPFRGTLIAPSVNLHLPSLRQGEVHMGAFFASAVTLHQGGVLRHQPYRPHRAGMPPTTLSNQHWHPNGVDFRTTIQGVTHDATHWFFTTTSSILRVPVTSNVDGTAPGPGVLPNTDRIAFRPLNAGHLGDPVFTNGRLYVPLESCSNCGSTGQGFAVFDRDLQLLGWAPSPWGSHAAWIAYDQQRGLFITSDEFDPFSRIVSFRIVSCQAGQPDCPGGFRVQDVTFRSLVWAGTGAPAVIGKRLQGGVVSSDGYLYLSADVQSGGIDPVQRHDAILIVKADSGVVVQERIIDTTSGCVFNQETEGLTIWDLEDGRAPGISGQLHLTVAGCDGQPQQSFRFVHFRVPELVGQN